MSGTDSASSINNVVWLYESADPSSDYLEDCTEHKSTSDEYWRIEDALRHARQPVRPQPDWKSRVLERVVGANGPQATKCPSEGMIDTSADVSPPVLRRKVLWASRGTSDDAVTAQVVDHISPGGQIAGRFRLIRKLARGSTGSVWAAVNEFTAREVAIKLVDRSDPVFCTRLLHEAQALGTLKHKNIVDIYNIDQTSYGKPFIVMELLRGEALFEALARKRRLEVPEVARIGRDVAHALAAAHATSVLHLGLNPKNIFLHHEPDLNGDPLVKVFGFGAPKVLGASDTLHEAVSTLLYASPEQLRSEVDLDQRADIWSLGVVMFEMLTGRHAFNGDTSQVIEQVLRGEIPRVDRYVRRVAPAMTEVVVRCMCRNPEEGYRSAEELALDLDRLVGQQSTLHRSMCRR
jgi:serine/threonine-protein kinase